MDADLCRLVAAAFNSPFYRRYSGMLAEEAGEKAVHEWLIDTATTTGTASSLPEDIRSFLESCKTSADIYQELFVGKATGLEQSEEDDRVLAKMRGAD